MPTSIFFNGQRRSRPSVYARVINNLTEQSAPSTGNLALVGDFPQLKAATPVRFTNSLDLADYMRGTNRDIDTAAALMFKPLESDSTIDSLTLVSAGDSTQASVINGGITVKSRLWGVDGNRLKVKIASNASDASLYDLEVFEGVVPRESVVALGDGAVASLEYTPALANETLDRVTVEIDATDLNLDAGVSYLEAVVQAGGNMLTDTTPCNGNVTLKILEDQTAPSTVNIVGLNLQGVVASEAVTIPATALANETFVTSVSFSKITQISASSAASFVGALRVDFNVFNKLLANIDSFEDTLNEIKSLGDELTGAFIVTLPAARLKGADLDAVSTALVYNASKPFTSNGATLINWFAGSAFVEAEKNSNTAPVASANAVRLTGGSIDPVVSADNWQAAFDAIKRVDVNIVVPFDSTVAVAQQAAQHAIDAAQDAGYERNVWVGTAAAQTVQQAYANWSKQLNDRNVAVTPQSIIVDGTALDPRFTACLLAGIQGATSISEPMTRKRPSTAVTGTVENFSREDDAGLAIRRGLVIFADPSSTGLRVERSVTSWLKDDNPVYSEVSANESVNQSIRLLREALNTQIGTRVTSARRAAVQKVAEKALIEQKRNGIIKNFKDLTVLLEGDTANVIYSLAAVEPLNFITVTANIVR
jgi:hypothetical protein